MAVENWETKKPKLVVGEENALSVAFQSNVLAEAQKMDKRRRIAMECSISGAVPFFISQ
jgi:hypothetical protein